MTNTVNNGAGRSQYHLTVLNRYVVGSIVYKTKSISIVYRDGVIVNFPVSLNSC